MKNTSKEKKILIIQGPNMNIIGHRPMYQRVTLGKLNKKLRLVAKHAKAQIKILQTRLNQFLSEFD